MNNKQEKKDEKESENSENSEEIVDKFEPMPEFNNLDDLEKSI